MKLFYTTLHGNATKWYDDLPNASITSMDQLEKTFLEKWGIKLEHIHMLIKILEYMKQSKNKTVKEFHTRFDNLLQQIPRSHCPEDRYLDYLYTNALLVNLGFLLSKKGQEQSKKLITWLYKSSKISSYSRENTSLLQESNLMTPKIPQILLVWRY
jgi:hypothetical protein